MPLRPPLTLLLDWDGTIATRDTLALIAAIGYRTSLSTTHPPPPWPHFTTSYATDYTRHKATYTPRAAARRTPAAELAWLNSLHAIERASIERVEASCLFSGVRDVDISTAAETAAQRGEIALRPGLEGLLGKVSRERVRIVSVNWSGRFIAEYLRGWARREGWVAGGEVRVVANEIGAEGRLERRVGPERGIWTAGDKRWVVEGVWREVGREGGTVYVGDSLTDLACLLDVDVGVCVRDEVLEGEQRALAEALIRLGVECRWIGEYDGSTERATGDRHGKALWWARDFQEIADSLVFEE